MLNLELRDCKLAVKASTNGKELDGEEIKTITLQLEGIGLDRRELNVLLGEPHAWDVLFNTGVTPPEPYLKSLKTLELREPIDGAAVILGFGLQQELVSFTAVKLTKIKLELLPGGGTEMSCRLTAEPTLDETFTRLLEHLGTSVEVEMRFEPVGQQQELPLNKFGEGEQPSAPKRRGRPPKTPAGDALN